MSRSSHCSSLKGNQSGIAFEREVSQQSGPWLSPYPSPSESMACFQFVGHLSPVITSPDRSFHPSWSVSLQPNAFHHDEPDTERQSSTSFPNPSPSESMHPWTTK